MPTATIIALLINPTGPVARPELRGVQNGARSLGLRLQVLSVNNEGDVDAALATLVQHQADGLVVAPDPLFNNRRNQIVALAARQGMPAIYAFPEFASSGGLMSYGVSLIDAYRQVGIYAGKILRGVKPADLPVQEAVKIDLVINLKTAKALGLAIPPSMLARADEVIE